MIGYLALIGFASTIPAANWLIGHVGAVLTPGGPHLIPVGFGLNAPSGVLMIGLALVLRDVVHERLGAVWAAGAIVAGGAMSAFLAPPALVIASTAAFLLSEAADMAVYTPLRQRRLALAVMASGLFGAIVDSAVFLWLAFGSLNYLPGQVVGKFWMTGIAAAALVAARRMRAV